MPAQHDFRDSKGSLRGVVVLVAEDCLDSQTLIKQFLEIAGAEVDTACNGDEAVAKALAKHYDIILMDVQMPVLDGISATRLLREKGYDGIVIALTAHVLPEECDKTLAAGCNHHFTKPIRRQELIRRIEEILRNENEKLTAASA